VILIVVLGLLATYTGYVIGQFKIQHPGVNDMSDAGMIIYGRVGKELLGSCMVLVLIFIMAAHVTTFSIMMNVVTEHGACSVIFGFLGAVVCLVLGLPRTLKNISYLSVVSCISITAAVVIAMVALGITKPNSGDIKAANPTDLAGGMIAVLNILIAYGKLPV